MFLKFVCSFLSYSLAGLYLLYKMIASAFLCFSPLTPQKICTLPWHMQSCSTFCFTSVLSVPGCVSLSIPRLHVSPTYDSSLLLTLSVVSFTLSAAPQRCCDAGRHYFCMQQIPRVVCCSALLTENNKTGNLLSLQVLHSWCEKAVPKLPLRKLNFRMAQFHFTSIDAIALWNEWKLF